MIELRMKPILLVVLAIAGQTFAQVSPDGDVVGKLVVGYQGWFGAKGDASPLNMWIHWGFGNGNAPAPNRSHFEIYPDMREYEKTYKTDLGNLGNGQPAQLFSSWDESTIDTHFRWMQEYSIDCVSFQVCDKNIFLTKLFLKNKFCQNIHVMTMNFKFIQNLC